MLDRSLVQIRGISAEREQKLWAEGIDSLAAFRNHLIHNSQATQRDLFSSRSHLSKHAQNLYYEATASLDALKLGDADYFGQRLNSREHYRVALSYPKETVFLDIETTGLSLYYDSITVVGVNFDGEFYPHIAGENPEKLKRIISAAKCLVTFNGQQFDLKFLKKEFPDLKFPDSHVDLRYLCKRIGLTGGQKEIELALGISRSDDTQDIKGEFAPVLWQDYRSGDLSAGKRLIKYNYFDTEKMKAILDHCVSELANQTPIPNFHQHRFAQNEATISFATKKSTEGRNRYYLPKPKGKTGPSITYKQLNKIVPLNDLKIVGIDLTGSEKRPTGWSLLKGKNASTKVLSTDTEIIGETIRANPTLVSIDSPLSLPFGRTSVFDDDPMRQEIGIMRQCERTLKRRGVNVYPALIPSMQRLTARGIRLANELRKVGIPVIESYPGAAQDIMGIVRKRKGLDHLAQGLHRFGIRGPYIDGNVNHDELDAITAAVVGLFFWTGKFEALGNKDEEYLIIPDLEVDTSLWTSRRAVGISGQIYSGKTTTAQYLNKRGYVSNRFSLVLEKLLREEGREVNRENLQEIGTRIHLEKGQRWLVNALAQDLKDHNEIVIDGMRWREDHSTLVELFGPGFKHIHISAPTATRELRYIKAGYSSEEFTKADKAQVESETADLGQLAHITIENCQTINKLQDKVRALLRPAMGEGK